MKLTYTITLTLPDSSSPYERELAEREVAQWAETLVTTLGYPVQVLTNFSTYSSDLPP